MQTSMTAPTAAVPRKSRRRWYILGFLLLIAATPVAWYFIAGWQGDRALAELLAEIDPEDPGWRWPDIGLARRGPQAQRRLGAQRPTQKRGSISMTNPRSEKWAGNQIL